jgi:hypothetical protein
MHQRMTVIIRRDGTRREVPFAISRTPIASLGFGIEPGPTSGQTGRKA